MFHQLKHSLTTISSILKETNTILAYISLKRMSSLKKYLLNVNLFEPPPNSREQEDDQRRRSNIIATRVYILILIVTLSGIGLGLSLIDQTTIITIKNPTREQFEGLPMDAQCSCSRISLPYGNFTSLQTSFYQVCSSDFVTDR
jgi:hypothetical protein